MVSRSKAQEFLGMDKDFIGEENMAILMTCYIEKCVIQFFEDRRIPTKTLTNRNLFKVRSDVTQFGQEKKNCFQTIEAKLMWVVKRMRPGIKTTFAFLCTRIEILDEDDWNKVQRFLQYIKGIIGRKQIIGCTELNNIDTITNVSYAVYSDIRSHTGGTITFGR